MKEIYGVFWVLWVRRGIRSSQDGYNGALEIRELLCGLSLYDVGLCGQ